MTTRTPHTLELLLCTRAHMGAQHSSPVPLLAGIGMWRLSGFGDGFVLGVYGSWEFQYRPRCDRHKTKIETAPHKNVATFRLSMIVCPSRPNADPH